MKPTPEYIHQLMTEKLAGIISAANEHYLDELIEKVPAVREKWQEAQSVFTSEDLENGLQRFGKWPGSNELVKPRYRIIPLYRKIAAAAASIAAILVVAWGLYAWLGKQPAREPDKLVFNAPVQTHIELKLADGSSIDLSREQGSIATAEVQLNNEQRTLNYSTSGAMETGINTLTVPAGQDYKLNLADGTEIWLNSTSEIRFPFVFNGSTREVTIDGEAFLKVAEDAERPFIVHLPKSTVRVLGTEFNVNSYDPGAEKIALLEGSVSLKTQTDEITVKPGYQAVYTPDKGWSQESFDEKTVLGWRQGLFYFYDSSFREICQVLPRWFGVNVVIDDPGIRTRRFAGIVDRNQPIEVFLDNLKDITDIDYYFEQDRKVLHFRDPSLRNDRE